MFKIIKDILLGLKRKLNKKRNVDEEYINVMKQMILNTHDKQNTHRLRQNGNGGQRYNGLSGEY